VADFASGLAPAKTLTAARSLQKAKLYSDEAKDNHLHAAKSLELVTKEVGTKSVSKVQAMAASKIQGAKELGQKMIRAAVQRQASTQAVAKVKQLAVEEAHAMSKETAVKSSLGGLLKTKLKTTHEWEAAGHAEDSADAALSAAQTSSLKLGESAETAKGSAIKQLDTMETAAKNVEKRATVAKVAADAKEHTAKLGAVSLMKQTQHAKKAVLVQKKHTAAVVQAAAKAGDALSASKRADETSDEAATAEEAAKKKMAKLPAGKATELMEARDAAINNRAKSAELVEQVGGGDAEAEQDQLQAQVSSRDVADAKQAAMILGNHVTEFKALESQLLGLKAVHSRAASLLKRAEERSKAARKLEKSATKASMAQIHALKVKMATTDDQKMIKLCKLKIAATENEVAQLDAQSHKAREQMLQHQAMVTKTSRAVDSSFEQANQKKAKIASEKAAFTVSKKRFAAAFTPVQLQQLEHEASGMSFEMPEATVDEADTANKKIQAAVKKEARKLANPTLKESREADESDDYIAALKSSRQATREQDLANEAKGKATSANNVANAAIAKAAAQHAENLSTLYMQHAAADNKVPGRVMLLSEEEGLDKDGLQEKIREAHTLRQQARQKMREMGDPIPDSLRSGSMQSLGESDGKAHPSAIVQAIHATHPHLKASIERSEKSEEKQNEKDDKKKAKEEAAQEKKKKKIDAKLAREKQEKDDKKKASKVKHSDTKAQEIRDRNKARLAKLKELKHKMDSADAKKEADAFKKSVEPIDELKTKKKFKKAAKKAAKKERRQAKRDARNAETMGMEKTAKKTEKGLSEVQAATEKALATKQAAEKVAAKAEKAEAKALKNKAKAEKAEAKALAAASEAEEAKHVTKKVTQAQVAAKIAKETSKWSRKLLKQEGINVPGGSMQELAKKLKANQKHIEKLTKEISNAFFARISAKTELFKAGKPIPQNLQPGNLVHRLKKEGVPLDLIMKAKARASKEEDKTKKSLPVPKMPSTKDAMNSGDPMVAKISKVKDEEKALMAKIAKLKKQNSKFDVNKKLAKRNMQEAKLKKEGKDAWIRNNQNTAQMMNTMAKDAKQEKVAMAAVAMKEKMFKASHLIKMAKKKELGAKFVKKHGPKQFKYYAKMDMQKVFVEEIAVKKRLAYQSKHGRHLILRTLSAQYILRNRENGYLRSGVGVLIALAGKMPVYPAVRTMRQSDADLQNDATLLIPKDGVTKSEKTLVPALNDQLTEQNLALGKLAKPGNVASAADIGPLIEAFDAATSAHEMLNNATTKIETRITIEADVKHKIPISKEEVAAASWKANQAKMDMHRLKQQLKVLRDILPAPVSKLQADLPELYNAQLTGLTSLKLQLKAIRASKSPHATPMLAEQDAQLKKRILEVTRNMVRHNSTKDTKANLLQDFLHHGRMQSCLTKEVEILTTIVSLEHTMSKTMLKKNKAYLEQREQSMQKEMNNLSVERANRLKEEISKMYKKKIVVLRQKESILKEVRRLLQRRLLRKLPKKDMLKEVDRLLRAKNRADQQLAEEKTQLDRKLKQDKEPEEEKGDTKEEKGDTKEETNGDKKEKRSRRQL